MGDAAAQRSESCQISERTGLLFSFWNPNTKHFLCIQFIGLERLPFSEERYQELLEKQILFESVTEVPVLPLSEILKQHISDKDRINFMDVDVEGLDYDVLLSNDWEIYRPVYLLVEIWDTSEKYIESSKESLFLQEKGYRLVAKANNTSFFRSIN